MWVGPSHQVWREWESDTLLFPFFGSCNGCKWHLSGDDHSNPNPVLAHSTDHDRNPTRTNVLTAKCQILTRWTRHHPKVQSQTGIFESWQRVTCHWAVLPHTPCWWIDHHVEAVYEGQDNLLFSSRQEALAKPLQRMFKGQTFFSVMTEHQLLVYTISQHSSGCILD